MTQSYPEILKAISIHAPHAYAICMGIKQAEYRTQPTNRRGWILIHASQSKDSDHCLADYGISKATIKRGAIIGAAQITNCAWNAEYGCYAYHLENPILFDQPIEGVKGCQAIFWGATQPEKQAAFAQAWALIEKAMSNDKPLRVYAPQIDDISIEAIAEPIDITQDLAIRGYYLEYEAQHSTEEKQAYRVFDSLNQEPLFQIYSTTNGWTDGYTKQIHSSPQLAIAQAREKTIERINQSRPLEVEQIDSDTFIIKNPNNGNHYVVRPNHPNPKERCECGDAHFRGARCKHQIAADNYLHSSITADIAQTELNQYIEQQALHIAPLPDIQFTSLDDNWEATLDGLSIATISYDREHLTQRYVVAVGGTEIHRTNTQASAENYIIWHYKQGTLPVVEEETEPCTIEDCNLIDNKGQQYTFRINGQLIGYIWLTETEDCWNNWRQFWINGDGTEYKDWRECGLKLAQLTRKDLYQTVAA